MSTFEDARRIALALPGTEEVKNSFRVGGKTYAAVYPEKLDPKKPRVANFAGLVVHVEDLSAKLAYLQSDSDAYFTTPHYDGYAIVLVWLERLDEPTLTRLLTEAWQLRGGTPG